MEHVLILDWAGSFAHGVQYAGAPPRAAASGHTWPQFLRFQASAILTSGFFTADLLGGTQAYVLAMNPSTSTTTASENRRELQVKDNLPEALPLLLAWFR